MEHGPCLRRRLCQVQLRLVSLGQMTRVHRAYNNNETCSDFGAQINMDAL